MPYFCLLIPVIIGILTDYLWAGIAVGFLLWLTALRGGSSAETERTLMQMRQEIDGLKQRLAALERHPPVSGIQTASEEDTENAATETAPLSAPAPQTLPEAATIQTKTALRPSETLSAEPLYETVQQRPSENQNQGFNLTDNPIAAWFLRGNPLLKTGIVVLFLGLAFLLRYASERIHVPVEARYLAVAAAGLAALFGGRRLQRRRREYGLALQGFGVAVMYLTVLAALKLHPLLSAPSAFVLMVLLVALTALIAVRQNAQIMAQIAVLGGMAAPVLVSDGSNRYLILFTYLALLNGGIAAIAWFKAWRPLNLTGFAATFAIAAAWGLRYYTPEYFASVEPFLLYHWLLYTFIAYLFARRRLSEARTDIVPLADNASLAEIWQNIRTHGLRVHVLDHTLLFGTMASAFALQYRMGAHYPPAGAWSALGFAAVYSAAALLLRRRPNLFVLQQAFWSLALMFVTLAVPLYFNRENTVILWAAEAALVYFTGMRLQRPHIRLGALAVYSAASLVQLNHYRPGTDTVLQGSATATLLTVLGGAAVYLFWYRYRRQGSALWERRFQTASLCAALFYASLLPLLFADVRHAAFATAVLAAVWAWCGRKLGETVFGIFAALCGAAALIFQAGTEIGNVLSASYTAIWPPLSTALFTAVAAYLLHTPVRPSEKNVRSNIAAGWLLSAVMVCFAVLGTHHALALSGKAWATLWTLPLAFAPLAFAAKRAGWKQGLQTALVFAPLFFLTVSALEIYRYPLLPALSVMAAATALHFYILNAQRGIRYENAWHTAGIILAGAAWTLFAGQTGSRFLSGAWAKLAWLAAPLAMWVIFYTQRQHAFFRRHQAAYLQTGLPLAAAFAAVWLLQVNIAAPLRPQPLPYIPLLNPLELVCTAIIWFALKSLPSVLPEGLSRAVSAVAAALAFVLISAGVMRAWHFYGGTEWRLSSMLHSFGLQAGLSVVWSLTAIILMVLGNRRGLRLHWLTGAALLGAVVVKLFLVELADSGGIARIASFITVGLLLLLVGWFAPVPPKAGKTED